jgi:hypothetical protein
VIRDPNFSYRNISHTASRGDVQLFLHFARAHSGNHPSAESTDERARDARFHSGREEIDRRMHRATNVDAAGLQAVRWQ